MKRILRLFKYVRDLESELETERVRLAACGVAALGWFEDEGFDPKYDSASRQHVLRLHRICERMVVIAAMPPDQEPN
jgi:hypothetical protein